MRKKLISTSIILTQSDNFPSLRDGIKLCKNRTCPSRYGSRLNSKSFFSTRGKQSWTLMKLYLWHLSTHKTNANMHLTPLNMHVCLGKSSGWRDKVNCNKQFNGIFTIVMASEFFCSGILLFCFELERNLNHFLQSVMNANDAGNLEENLDEIVNL